jgi:hypothetical protein
MTITGLTGRSLVDEAESQAALDLYKEFAYRSEEVSIRLYMPAMPNRINQLKENPFHRHLAVEEDTLQKKTSKYQYGLT